jgi:hypothetical protein
LQKRHCVALNAERRIEGNDADLVLSGGEMKTDRDVAFFLPARIAANLF